MIARIALLCLALFSGAASGQDAPLFSWKFQKFYGMCLISVESIDRTYRLSFSSIGPRHTPSDLTWSTDVTQIWQPHHRYNITFLFDNHTKSTTTGVILEESDQTQNKMSLGEDFNLEAFSQHDLLELYVDDQYVTAFALPGARTAIKAWINCTIED